MFQNVFERHQKLEKACLLYDIKKCAGPCISAISETDYKELTAKLENFYSGKSDQHIDEKVNEMMTFLKIKNMKKQQAKNIISHLENARTTQTLMVADKKSVDVVGIDTSNFDVVISSF